VLNELDALVNVDFASRLVKEQLQQLNLIRIGTSGTMRQEIPVDSFLVSHYGIGMDGLLNFYERSLNANEEKLNHLISVCLHEKIANIGIRPTVAQASPELVSIFSGNGWYNGITVTATGFYAPQNRTIRAKSAVSGIFELFDSVEFDSLKVTNLEMETAGIFGLAKIMGHRAVSLNAILANRRNGSFSLDPDRIVDELIRKSLEILVSSPL
jgi:uridine phosphorylase